MAVDDGRVISNFIVQALRGDDITIYGDGSQTRSFCYVDDLIEGFARLMNSKVAGPINLGNPNEFSMRELAELVIRLSGSKSKISFLDLPPDDPKQRQPEIAQAKNLLGWQPEIELEQGLAKTIEYFRATLK